MSYPQDSSLCMQIFSTLKNWSVEFWIGDLQLYLLLTSVSIYKLLLAACHELLATDPSLPALNTNRLKLCTPGACVAPSHALDPVLLRTLAAVARETREEGVHQLPSL